ncbi:MAG: metallophosphoesterase [Chloroherpetonaceae bacterium]|nr:metallophosphoesterase [Chthonomonadaceae bacterium]MDW8208705.1 metallophosphoesterase [Chloroherpetonaceae bacterium]
MSIPVTEQVLPVPYLPAALRGLRVAHLTDLHRCYLTPDPLLHEAVHRTVQLCPDLIVLTGDFVYRAPTDIEPCAEILSPLRADLGVYAILGNHDYDAGAAAVVSALQRIGFQLLINRRAYLAPGLWIAGVDDDRAGRPDPAAAFDGVGTEEPVLTLIHNPRLVRRLPNRPMIALAGHTHGGQVILPWVTAWKLRQIGAECFRAGWYTVGNIRMYVNRGIGNAGVPFRLGAPPEIALFVLKPAPMPYPAGWNGDALICTR